MTKTRDQIEVRKKKEAVRKSLEVDKSCGANVGSQFVMKQN
jgi:hypothetical protein